MVTMRTTATTGERRPPPYGAPAPTRHATPSRSARFLTALQDAPGGTSRTPATSPWPYQPLTRPRAHGRPAGAPAFLQRSLGYLAEQGLRQYLTVGGGEPARRVLRETVQRIDPQACTAVVDADAGLMAFRQAVRRAVPTPGRPLDDVPGDDLMFGRLPGPWHLRAAAAPQGVDLCRPVALLLVCVLHHVIDDRAARADVAQLVQALPAGSFVVMTHATSDHPSPGLRAAVRAYERAGLPIRPRSRREVTDLLAGLDLVEPGVELLSSWGRDPAEAGSPAPEQVACWGAVARVA